jgi:hypothetical protein
MNSKPDRNSQKTNSVQFVKINFDVISILDYCKDGLKGNDSLIS